MFAESVVDIPLDAENISASQQDRKLILEIDLDDELRLSSTQKTTVVATTNNLQYIEIDGVKWTINLWLGKPRRR